MDDDIVIRVDHVSKNFVLPHDRVTSLKGAFTNLARGKALKTKETQHALKDVSFEVKKGEFFGIVGRNGSGKSTLLKMLANIYQPTKGKVTVRGRLVPFIELGVGFNPELTGRENVYLNGAMMGFSRKQVDAMYDSIVAFAELEQFMDQKLKNYSSGMQIRLAFSVAIKAEADVLLVDEILAVGDADFQRKCYDYFRKLKREKKTVVFVSHDMNAVREYCNTVLLIDDSRVKDIPKAQVISQKYSQLFLDQNVEEDKETGLVKHWGSGDAKYQNVHVEQSDGKILVKANVKVYADIEKLVYGLHIFSDDGSELTAVNNRLILAPDIENLSAGDKLQIEWEVLNIFNDGKFKITLTLVDNSGSAVDWNNDAATFVVKRPDRSTTAILPPVTVNIVKKH